MTNAYDLVVIGSGPAGQSAAELATFLGHSALIVERATPGGVVTTVGGAPTKTLREVALAMARERQLRGGDVASSSASSDGLDTLRTRTLDVCRSLQGRVASQILAGGVDYIRGTARLTSNRTISISVDADTHLDVSAQAIVVATGSRSSRMPGVAYDDPDIYDSNEIFSMRRLPPDIAIVGGGPVGVEFATIFTALGVPVTLVDGSSRLLPNMDGELAQMLTDQFAKSGVRLMLGTRIDTVSRRAGQLTMALSNGTRLETEAVLFAAGRVPNTEDLGLEAAGVEIDRRGRITVDRHFQTTCAGIYAVGDVVGPTLASLAMQQGRAATCHAFGLVFGVPVDRQASGAVYGVPEIAGVGKTEEQVRDSGEPYVVGRCDLSQTARGAIAGRGGCLKLIVGADDRRLLGVHCLGELASELVAMGHAVLHMSGTIDVFLTIALNTPTYSAAYRDAAIDVMAQLVYLAGRSLRSVPTHSREPIPQLQTTGALS